MLMPFSRKTEIFCVHCWQIHQRCCCCLTVFYFTSPQSAHTQQIFSHCVSEMRSRSRWRRFCRAKVCSCLHCVHVNLSYLIRMGFIVLVCAFEDFPTFFLLGSCISLTRWVCLCVTVRLWMWKLAASLTVLYCCRINIDAFIYSNYVYFIGGNDDDVRLFPLVSFIPSHVRSVHSVNVRAIVCICALIPIFSIRIHSAAWSVCHGIGVIASWLWSMCWIRRCCSSKNCISFRTITNRRWRRW